MQERRPEVAGPLATGPDASGVDVVPHDAGDVSALRPVGRLGALLAYFRDRDHTRGSLLTSIWVLSVPSTLQSVAGFGLFQLVELRFLGQLGPVAVAAAGSTNQTLRQVFMMFVFGMTVAAQMMIARLIGAGSVDGAEHVAGQSLVLGLAASLVGALLGAFIPEEMVRLVATDPEVIALATIYVQITFLTMSVMFLGQIFASILTGAGDTTTPLLITFATTPVSLVTQYGLTFGAWGMPELGIAGIALGAAIGGLSGTAVSLWALFSGRCRVHLRARHLLPDPQALRRVLGLSWQPALHMIARSTMIMFFMLLAGRLGGEVQAAYTIGLRLEMLPIMLAFPIANACSTVVSQNLGAGNLARSWRAIWISSGIEVSLLWPTAVLIFFWRHELVSLFAQDPQVAALAAEYLVYTSLILGFYGLYFVAFRSLQAAGDMNSPMIISITVALLLGAPLGYYLSTQSGMGATGMWIANLVYAVVNSLVMVGWLLTGRWTRRALQTVGPPPRDN